MAVFKAKQIPGQVGQGKYYPMATTLYKPAEISDLAKIIEKSSTVAESDILAVLNALPLAMTAALDKGSTVHLQGLGTFYLTIDVKKGAGKATANEVSVQDIKKTNVRFLPESSWDAGRTVQTRSLVQGITWVKLEEQAATGAQATTPSADTPASDTPQTGGSDDQQQDPMG